MKRATLVAVLGLMCALPLAAQSITVTKPVAGATCTKGAACAIAWTVTGQPGSTGIIELLEETTTNVVRVIKSDAQIANLQYSWTVPNDVAAGKYRVRVRVAWLVVSPPGGVFTIKAQIGGSPPQPGLGTKRAVKVNVPGVQAGTAVLPVKILFPVAGETWEVGHQYLIKWTADTKPDDGFTVDLCNAGAVKVRTLLDGAAQHNPDGSWQITAGTACNDPEGSYKIRVTSWYAKKGATTGLITAVIKTKKIIENIPVHFQNATLECRDYGNTVSCQDNSPLPAGRAGAGHEFFSGSQHYRFCISRTRLTVNLSVFQGKKGDVESATMLPGDAQNWGGAFCAGSLVALSAADVNTWNRYKVPQNAVLYPLSGWSAPFPGTGVDITTPTRAWINKTTQNLGFVVTGADQVGGTSMCYSSFTPIMYVTFIEKPNPCSAH